MTIRMEPSPLAIMAGREVRAANEAGSAVAVLSASLDVVVWANGAGRRLLGLPAGGSADTAGSAFARSALGRQIKTAARPLAASGRTAVLVRVAAGLSAGPVTAELARIETPEGGFVLLRAAGPKPPAGPVLAETLLGEAAGAGAGAAVFGMSGLAGAANGFETVAAEALLPEVEAFRTSEEEIRTMIRPHGRRITLARVSSEFVIARIEAPEGGSAGEGDEPGAAHGAPAATLEAQAPAEALPGVLPGGGAMPAAGQPRPSAAGNALTRAISMSALVQRWHRRGGDPRPLQTFAPAAGDEAVRRKAGDARGPSLPDASGEALPSALDAAQEGPGGGIVHDDGVGGAGKAAVAADAAAVVAPESDRQPGRQPGLPQAASSETRPLGERVAAGPVRDEGAADPGAAPRGSGGDGAPFPGNADAMPTDEPAGPRPAEPQPVEKVSVTTLPDVPAEEADGLDLPISTDEEAPPAETILSSETAPAGPGEDGSAAAQAKHGGAGRPDVETAPLEDAAAASSRGQPDLHPAGGPARESGGAMPAADPRLDEAGLLPEEAANGRAQAGLSSFAPRFEVAPVRFVWQIDRHGAFRSLSPEFAAAVGPRAADVLGRSFREVAEALGLEGSAEIMRLLDRRDTWSGRSLAWPVENSDRKAPIDLAALPVYARDRSFDGFRGFGIVRMNESVPDADARGLALAGRAALPAAAGADADSAGNGAAAPEEAAAAAHAGGQALPAGAPAATKPFFKTFEADLPGVVFGRRSETPQPLGDNGQGEADAGQPKVIRLEERRRPKDAALSQAEEAAFRAIGMKLGSPGDAEAPGALAFADGLPADAAAEPGAAVPAMPGPLSGEEEEDGAAFDLSAGPAGAAEEGAAEEALPADPAPHLDAGEGPEADAGDPLSEAAGGREEPDVQADADGERRVGEDETAGPAVKAVADAATPPGRPADDADLLPGQAMVPGPVQTPSADAAAGAAVPVLAWRGDLSPPEADGEGFQPDAEAEAEPDAETEELAPEAAGREPGPDAEGGEPEPDAEGGEPASGEAFRNALETVFASLPLPVLVQAADSLVYANRRFAELTAYASVEALQAAGGLDALIVGPGDALEQDGRVAIRLAGGDAAAVGIHLQRVTFAARSCLLMSFTPAEGPSLPAMIPPAPVGEAAASVPGPLPMAGSPARPDSPEEETEDLRQQVEEMQAVLDTATDGIVLLDPAGAIRAMNGSAHALFGIGESEAVGRHLSSLFALESQKAAADYLDTLRHDGMAGILNDGREVIGRVAQGGFIPLFITVGRLSRDRGWCVVIRDIAHWKRIEEDLVNARRQAEAASLHKSRFLANISHELRTPLNAIIGFADVMASECFGPIGNERYIEYLGDIKRSGHHVLDLVNDLLDISKIEAGKLDLTFEAVSLNEVVSEVVSLMQPQANRERVIVRSNLPSSVPPVVADRRTMRQIALNLIANAIRFTPSGGQIIASTTYTAEGDVLLRFRDSGIGMTEREIEIALTPFQQVHAPSANRGEGTGLGLPLTKAMVEANRAHFAINSVPGEGTLVEISFPSQRVLAD